MHEAQAIFKEKLNGRTQILILFQFPKIVEAIFDSIDAISIEAARIIQRPLNNTILDENGSAVLENGGRSATLTPSFGAASLGGGAGEPGDHHHNLQVGFACLYLSQ